MWLSKLSTHRRAAALVSQQRFAAVRGVHSTQTLQYLTETSFESLPISERSKKVLTEQMKYEFLTHVQNETIPHILEGKDVLAKGKTGNGKTIAFLLPSIENMLKERNLGGSKDAKIATLVISPTRELANQIAVEAEKLTAAHGMRTACLVGGTSMNSDVKQLSNPKPLDVLVATPGRLQAHLEENSGNIRQKLGNLRVLVLDEADRLLDMGFRKEIMKIITNLPKQRQTLLFSATLPESTEELKNVALRPDYEFIDTIHEDDHQTNVQTVQEVVTCDLPNVIPAVETILTEHMHQDAYKILVFLPTARSAQFMAQLFVKAKFPNVLEMHSRKSQSARTKAADAFRSGKKVIMFSSDVSARGVDYPDVSLVLQIGLTDRDQYIHRLGRTARAGMEGRGILVLADFEKPFLKDLSDLPLLPKEVDTTAAAAAKGFRTIEALAHLAPGSELEKSAQQSYQAFLGFYNSNQKKLNLDKEKLVEIAEHYSHLIGLSETPRIDKKILRKMGLFGVKGLEPASESQRPQFTTKGSSRGGGSGGGSRGGNRGGSDRRGGEGRGREGRSFERSSGPREPRNFGESSSTPPSERFNMDDAPVYESRSRSSDSPRSRERFGSEERRGRSGGDRRASGDDFVGKHEERPRRSESAPASGSRFNSGERSGRFEGERRGRRDGEERAPRESRFGSEERRGGGREGRFEKRTEGRSSSSYSSERAPRAPRSDGGEERAPRESRFSSEERRGGGGDRREGRFERRTEGRSSSSSPQKRYGSERSGSVPHTTSHRRDRGEQKARERTERYSKRF
ncbi:Dead/deah box RNA helicase [Globisporangium polare]